MSFKKPKQMNLICGTTGLKVIAALTSELLQREENNSKVIPNLKAVVGSRTKRTKLMREHKQMSLK